MATRPCDVCSGFLDFFAGSGKVQCESCRGTGRYDGKWKCRRCGGKGYVRCPKCHGTRTIGR
jgi:DnaJ-class molecular chaperone